MIDNTYDLLIESWKFKDNTSKVSLYDDLCFKTLSNGSRLKVSNFYPTHIHPQPWWGNIKDPKIIILAINPSYDHYYDDVEEIKCGDFFRRNIKRNSNQLESWISELKRFKVGNNKSKGTYKWWEKSLGELIIDTDDDIFSKNVGIFNLVGYRSKTKSFINKICYETNIVEEELQSFINQYNNVNSKVSNKRNYMLKLLPTQNALILHLNNIIKNNKLIVIWGIKDYKEAGLNFIGLEDNLLLVNKYVGSDSTLKTYKNNNINNNSNKRFDCLDNKNGKYKSFNEYYESLLEILK